MLLPDLVGRPGYPWLRAERERQLEPYQAVSIQIKHDRYSGREETNPAMPTRKKTTITQDAAMETVSSAVDPAAKPAPRRRTSAAKTEPAASQEPMKKTAPRAKTPKSAAATHKAPAKRSATPKGTPSSAEVVAPAPAPFQVEEHRVEIEREAYFLWERRGRAHGYDASDWVRAVEVVRARYEGV